jgi:PAS domain S-box-containing protein
MAESPILKPISPPTESIASFREKLLDSLFDGVYFVDNERRIQYWNQGAEDLTGYSASDAVGRYCFDNFLVHVDAGGRALCMEKCPLASTIADGDRREADVYLRHKHGHRVPVTVRVAPIVDSAGLIIGAVEVFSDRTEKTIIERRVGELESLAFRDALTGVPKSRYVELKIKQAIQEVEQFDRRVGLLMIDIDHFKQVNDNFGHDIGDEALKAVCQTLTHALRSGDTVRRWGGEEFLRAEGESSSSGSPIRHDRLAVSEYRELSPNIRPEEESTLRRDSGRLRLLMAQSRNILLFVGIDGRVIDCNRAAVEAYGYSRDELLGLRIEQLREPSTLAHVKHQMQIAYESGILFETTHVKKDGSPFSVEVSSRKAIIEGEEILLSIIHDITTRKKIENNLRLTQFSVENAADAVLWIEEDGRITYANKQACKLFGYSKSELTGASVLDIDVHITRDAWAQHWQSVKLHGALSFESSHRTRDGHTFSSEVTASHVSFEGRELHCSFIRSIEERNLLEEQFRQAQKVEAVGRLAGGVAHDFNNILMVITAFTEIMQNRLGSDHELQNNVTQVLNAAKKGAALTYQLLAFSRKQVLAPLIINLNMVVEDTSKMIHRLIGEDIELNVSLSEALWRMKADQGQIVQVLMNLCVNARDAMREGGELRIETKNVSVDVESARERPALVPGDYAVLVVSDNGTGMTKDVQTHLFDPFFTTKGAAGKGTGLGLSTVYGIVKQSGGYIWVDSELGRGSSFTIYFPAIDDPLTETTITPETKEVEGQGEVILLVEDDEALRESISAYLNLHGYKVLEAVDGADALHIAKQHAESIQVLVTDVILPKLSGAELAREVAKISPNAVTLYMSGYTDRELIDYDPANLRTGFLQKPFGLRTLLEKIGEMIVRR